LRAVVEAFEQYFPDLVDIIKKIKIPIIRISVPKKVRSKIILIECGNSEDIGVSFKVHILHFIIDCLLISGRMGFPDALARIKIVIAFGDFISGRFFSSCRQQLIIIKCRFERTIGIIKDINKVVILDSAAIVIIFFQLVQRSGGRYHLTILGKLQSFLV